MNKFVLDASALLALLNQEVGAEKVENYLPNAVISTVNYAEVVTRLIAVGMPEMDVREILAILGLEVIPFDVAQGFQAGAFYSKTKSYGLSLGDRACLGLATFLELTAVTADQAWANLDIEVEVTLIR